jgi:hypothetical protein
MMKRYIISIFLLGAVCSSNAMDDDSEEERVAGEKISVRYVTEEHKIIAQTSIAPYGGGILETSVIKDLRTNDFVISAMWTLRGSQGPLEMTDNPNPRRVERLQAKIAQFEATKMTK